MSIAETFSEKQENYHLYLSRMDQLRVALTRENSLKRAEEARRHAEAELDQAITERELERIQKENALVAEERAIAEKEKERAEKEKAIAETERLRHLLKDAGLLPPGDPHA